MTGDPPTTGDLLAVEVGSSRIKLGLFGLSAGCDSQAGASTLPIAPPRLPKPAEVWSVTHRDRDDSAWQGDIERWLESLAIPPSHSMVAAVDPAVGNRLTEQVLQNATSHVRRLTSEDIAIETRVERPERVGVDRLLNAAAARRLVEPADSVLVIDAGTAITVDLTSSNGVFQGGAILPGPHTAASALSQATARLPHIQVERREAPPPVGRSTEEAIAAGIYWGTVGAIRQVVDEIATGLTDAHAPSTPVTLLTGGDAHWLATPLSTVLPGLRWVEHLTLAGLAIQTPEFS